jgi:hypothetical protein
MHTKLGTKSDNRRVYEQPLFRKLTLDQATLFLVGHAYIGHQGAKVIMELLFPMPLSDSFPDRHTKADTGSAPMCNK